MSKESYPEISECNDLDSVRNVISGLSHERRTEIGRAALSTVIARNWCGVKDVCSLPSCLLSVASQELSFLLNKPFSQARSLDFLLLAKCASIDVLKSDRSAECQLLSFETALVWQTILNEPAVQLKQIMDEATSDVSKWKRTEDEWAEFWLCRADAHLMFYEYEKCDAATKRALEHAGMNVELAGQMGKRTRWQQTSLPQLTLTTESVAHCPAGEDADLPTNCGMNDDTLLEKVAYEQDVERPRLTATQLCCLIALFNIEKRTQHNDEIQLETLQAYVEEVTSQRRGWAVQCAALLHRSDLERHKRRKVERACSQSEYIAKVMDGIDDTTAEEVKWSRVRLVLPSTLCPWWKCRIIHSDILISLGCTAEALLCFEHLEMWDRVIECYKSIGQLEKAESLIRRLLAEHGDDQLLYCLLGDITMEAKYYEKAIELTNDKSTRARKSMGILLLARKQYESAYKHFRRSLELQPIQLGVWYNAGYCAWSSKMYAEAAQCYHRCVSLEPEHFEAWNNLSAAYIRLDQKDRARRILQEALKFNYEHSNVWENYLFICVDTGDFAQAILAYHRLLDLHKQVKDDEILEIISKALLRSIHEDSDSVELRKLKDDLLKLFARITAHQTLSSMGWRCYAELKKPSTVEDFTEFEKYIQLLEKSVNVVVNKPGWAKDVSSVENVLEVATLLAEERLRYAEKKGGDAEKQAKSRIRMSLRPILTTSEKEFGPKCQDCQSEIVKGLAQEASAILERVVA